MVAENDSVQGPLSASLDDGVTVEDNSIVGPLTVFLCSGTVTVSGNEVRGPTRVQ